MQVFELLEKIAARYPDRTAVSHDENHTTYARLLEATNALADRLSRLPSGPGARVALLFENSVEYVEAFFAVFKSGRVAVPLDTSLTADGLKYILKDCQAEALVCSSRFRRLLPKILDEDSTLRLIICDKNVKLAHKSISVELLGDLVNAETVTNDPPMTVDEGELAAIFYTSGSTGTSKGVMLSHRNLISNTLATVEYLRLTENDSIMVILPFYYIYGNSLLLTHMAAGGRVVIDNRFMYPEVILDTMEKEGVTGLSGVPSNFMILLGNSTFCKRKFPALRYFTQAGGAMAPEVIRQLMDAFPDKEVWIMYGQTEAAPRVTYLPPERLKEKLGSIGIPVPGVQITIVDEQGQELPAGEVGEIMVTGPNVMLGYWNQAEEEKEVLRDGKLFTGDLARMDEDGYFYVVGRRKEIIKVGGNRVSVKEIEECVLENDKVLEAAVVGVPDPLLGEAVKLVVVLRPGCTAEPKEMQVHCQRRLAPHKVPGIVTFAESLPKLQTGKVNKLALKQLQPQR